jgi:dTDP-4-amino-4,6-dideoxygalactose transaminase
MIPFNKPYLTGRETQYIREAVETGKISGNGMFTKKCHDFFESHFGFKKCLLTTSCTDALEMAAILLNIQAGDEVIMPSYTFVSTANAFVLRGAIIRFADSNEYNPNVAIDSIKELINEKTKAIVVVHYAGIACDMDSIMALANNNGIYVVEDAAQSIDSTFKGEYLGSIGHLAAFSFHETKNIISGEGGMLVINDESFVDRAEIIWEKGTNRSAFFKGEVDKYGWVDVGSSFLPSEIMAAFLYAQIECMDDIQQKRIGIWEAYREELSYLNDRGNYLPVIPYFAANNAHMFYLTCGSLEERDKLIEMIRSAGAHPVFHYIPLHTSPFYIKKYSGKELINCDRYADTLVRLPLFYNLGQDQKVIIKAIRKFYK